MGVQLVQVLTYRGTDGSEKAAQSVTAGSGHPLIGPDPACGILDGVPKWAMRKWRNGPH
jgi:hypothetical protein